YFTWITTMAACDRLGGAQFQITKRDPLRCQPRIQLGLTMRIGPLKLFVSIAAAYCTKIGQEAFGIVLDVLAALQWRSRECQEAAAHNSAASEVGLLLEQKDGDTFFGCGQGSNMAGESTSDDHY